jgi:hypothetical protein
VDANGKQKPGCNRASMATTGRSDFGMVPQKDAASKKDKTGAQQDTSERVLRVWAEMLGSHKCRVVGKSQPEFLP